MKRFVLLICGLFLLSCMQAQHLDKMTIASGSVTDSRMSVTIGEPCIFTIQAAGGSLVGGAQGGAETGVTAIPHYAHSCQLKLYPNPVLNQLFVQVESSESSEAHFKVFDAAGKLLLDQRQVSHQGIYQLDVADLPRGGYLLSISFADEAMSGHVAFVKAK